MGKVKTASEKQVRDKLLSKPLSSTQNEFLERLSNTFEWSLFFYF